MEQFDGLDIIVNNAGYTWDASIQNHSDEQFEAMLAVHLIAPFRILRAAAEPIRVMAKGEAQEGREVFRKVVNISSIAGLYGNFGQASYSSAKASLIGLTRTLAKEWGRFKVNVNRSEEHTSELQSLMRNSYADFCLKQKKIIILQQPP